jgi:hypothetical protein
LRSIPITVEWGRGSTRGVVFFEARVDIIEPPTDKPWGLREMQIRDPDGLRIVIVEVPETQPLRRR